MTTNHDSDRGKKEDRGSSFVSAETTPLASWFYVVGGLTIVAGGFGFGSALDQAGGELLAVASLAVGLMGFLFLGLARALEYLHAIARNGFLVAKGRKEDCNKQTNPKPEVP